MPYIPLNRIKTNLFTSGRELQFLETGEEYIGHYHRYYDGRYFTEKSPDVEFIQELELISESTATFQESSEVEVYTSGRGLYSNQLVEEWDLNLIQTYRQVAGNSLTQNQKSKLPQPYFYTPSDQDYQVGEIIRYFTKKTNELKYTEVDQQTYQNFFNQQAGYAWEFYIAFQLPWQISGERQEVEATNRNITQLTQRRLGIQGLPEYLKYDYLKFYKES